MATTTKRVMLTLRLEWEPMLEYLKKERFYKETQAEMSRYIISRGLEVLEADVELTPSKFFTTSNNEIKIKKK